MNELEVSTRTGLISRQIEPFGIPDNAWKPVGDQWRCQLGRNVPYSYLNGEGRRVNDVQFHVVAYGRDWDNAFAMWRGRNPANQ